MTFDLVVVGGGAAGFFAAITCAEHSAKSVLILEKTSKLLHKVKISGGGRCNVTHHCFEPRELSRRYPRGEKSLIGPLHRFGPMETIEWFSDRGVALTTEPDGRMFPVSNRSQTIVDTLVRAAGDAGVEIKTSEGVTSIVEVDAQFEIMTERGMAYRANNVLLATGGTRNASGARLAADLGHSLQPATPSLFTFKIRDRRIEDLGGLSVDNAEVSICDSKLRSDGPVLITHWGLSGPGILKISAWGARELAERGYHFDIIVNWIPGEDPDEVIATQRAAEGKRRVSTRCPFGPIPKRLWQRMVTAAEISENTTWAELTKAQASSLVTELQAATFEVRGKSTNKDEFVTCGGVDLDQVNFKTMESKLVPGLYFAGEVLDVDGITGGYNFQNAWTSGFHAGTAIAAR